MQSSQIYTLPELIAAISKDTTFEADFLYLPRAATLETEFIETVRKNGPTGEFEGQILVGHTNLLSDPTHSQRRPVWSGVHVGDSNSEEPNKRPRQDDFTEEFQRLVQRIRKHADADSNAYKAEIERLKLSTTRIQQENKDAEHLLEAECTNTVNLSSQISLLRARNKELEQTMHQTNEAQEHKIKEIEKELQELREFKQKVKGLFRG
ncbi:hypothetical protein EKO04_007257 [Ascochyta lentis]|uniref:Uncharacterized protein n=1 Tax=Ascochyta lentis TaxID=205686 RepID=A0A8H7J0M0_9PLEO|nr:hypothetical protein EKO04_007257 [Ascochyta lentis]